MAVFVQQTSKCYCGKEFKFFSGFENGAWSKKGMIRPLCEECTDKVEKFIEEELLTEDKQL